ncbi:MAG: hypothetical protein GY850_42890, partial [bacterium]|nr:hypothetical protein [bacterium]
MVNISDKSLIDVTGDEAGSIFIRSGEFVLDDSSLHAKTSGDKDGGGIYIQSDNISMINGADMIC